MQKYQILSSDLKQLGFFNAKLILNLNLFKLLFKFNLSHPPTPYLSFSIEIYSW